MKRLSDPEFTKKIAMVMILIVTLLTAAVGGLSADAAIRASNANRESQVLAQQTIQSMQRRNSTDMYEMSTLYLYVQNMYTSLSLQMLALELLKDERTQDAAQVMLQAAQAEGRAERLQALSIFFRDPRYAPKNEGELPNLNAYAADFEQEYAKKVKKQNAASDRYSRWDGKSSVYVSIVTVLSIVLFLLGLGQVVSNRLRIILSLFGAGITGLALLWLLITLLT